MGFDLLLNGKPIEGVTSITYKDKNQHQYEFYHRIKNKLYLRNSYNKIVIELNNIQLHDFLKASVKKGSKIHFNTELN